MTNWIFIGGYLVALDAQGKVILKLQADPGMGRPFARFLNQSEALSRLLLE